MRQTKRNKTWEEWQYQELSGMRTKIGIMEIRDMVNGELSTYECVRQIGCKMSEWIVEQDVDPNTGAVRHDDFFFRNLQTWYMIWVKKNGNQASNAEWRYS